MADNVGFEVEDAVEPTPEPGLKPCLWKDCTTSFSTLDALLTHLSSIHYPARSMKKGEWKCQWNGCEQKAYSARTSLVTHVPKHDLGFAPPTCTICLIPQTFRSQLDLESHNLDLHVPLPPPTLPFGDGGELPALPSLPPPPLPPSSSLPQDTPPATAHTAYLANPALPVYNLDLSHLPPRYYRDPFICRWNQDRDSLRGIDAGGGCKHLIKVDVEGFEHVVHHIRRRAQGYRKWNCFWSACPSYFGTRQLLIDHLATAHFKIKYRKCPREGCSYAFSLSSHLSNHLKFPRCGQSEALEETHRLYQDKVDAEKAQAEANASGSESSAVIDGENRSPEQAGLESENPDLTSLQISPLPPSQIPIAPVISYYTPR
ncbi:hypothetical protein JCM3765_006194 [Sporobolomyces pararoseus]